MPIARSPEGTKVQWNAPILQWEVRTKSWTKTPSGISTPSTGIPKRQDGRWRPSGASLKHTNSLRDLAGCFVYFRSVSAKSFAVGFPVRRPVRHSWHRRMVPLPKVLSAAALTCCQEPVRSWLPLKRMGV